MSKNNPLPINTKVMTGHMGLGTIRGFILDETGNGWKYHVMFDDMDEINKFWFAGESIRKATWLEVLLYG